MQTSKMELVCPAGNLAAVKAAVDNGADAVYVGFSDNTNARFFAGLNFSHEDMHEAATYIQRHGRKFFIAINTFAQPGRTTSWHNAVDAAAGLKADAIILADIGLLAYATHRHPQLPRHLSVQASATNLAALQFYQQEFGVRRAVLPRVLSARHVARMTEKAPLEIEVFGFGSLCIMAEGRCYLSSYVAGDSPNNCGACSPAHAVRWQETSRGLESRLNGILVDRFGPGEHAGYPTLCKGRFIVEGQQFHALEEPTSLNAMALLPELQRMGVKAIKIEGRQRSPAYVAKVAKTWRQAIDAASHQGAEFSPHADWNATLEGLSEGQQTTLGAYHRPWR